MNRKPAQCHGIGSQDADLDWEDWDPSAGSFIHHMIAGSVAGIAEHTVMFPVDTIKTFAQCEQCATPCMIKQQQGGEMMSSFSAAARLVRQEGFMRLWRGVSTMFSACVPAHAAYFSALEYCKQRFGVNEREHNVMGAAAAGAIATLFHDAIMTPMDVIKQRLQLGYYKGMMHCISSILQTEGPRAFYLSLPITLFMNVPYGCVMVAANESLKRMIRPNGDYTTSTYMLAGSGAGAIAAAATTPLDLIKTRLQTQVIVEEGCLANERPPASTSGAAVGREPSKGPANATPGSSNGNSGSGGNSGRFHSRGEASSGVPAAAAARDSAGLCGARPGGPGRGQEAAGGYARGGSRGVGVGALPYLNSHNAHSCPPQYSYAMPPSSGGQQQQQTRTHVTSTSSSPVCLRAKRADLKYKGILDAAKQIWEAEGVWGFFRGMGPRLMVHTPSVAISWTTYETVKDFLRSRWE